METAIAEKKYRPFIKNFSHVEAGTIPTETRSIDEVLLERVERLAAEVRALRRSSGGGKSSSGGTYLSSARSFRNILSADDTSLMPRDFKIRVPLGKEPAAGRLLGEEAAVSYDTASPGLLRVNFAPWTTLDQMASAFQRVKEAGIEVTIVSDDD